MMDNHNTPEENPISGQDPDGQQPVHPAIELDEPEPVVIEEKKSSHEEHHHHHHRFRRRKKKKLAKYIALGILIVLLVLLVTAATAFFVLRTSGRSSLFAQANEVAPSMQMTDESIEPQEILDAYTVKYKGKKYHYNQNIVTILVMGIDKSSLSAEEEGSGKAGQSDANFLLTIDSETGKTSLIAISRDTITDIHIIGATGDSLGMSKAQLALGFSYGDGRDISCQYMVDAVSKLFYGLPIHGYCAIDLDAMPILADTFGGVEVTLLHDMTWLYPDWTEGSNVLLKGDAVTKYIRTRYHIADGTNEKRMERQKQFLMAFIKKAMSEVKNDFTLIGTLYNAISDDMVTNISFSEITYLATLALKMDFSSIDYVSVPGTTKEGNLYMEFYPDEKAFYELILDQFYTCEE